MEMEEAKESTSFRILMFPWLAHGHISPFLQLSKKLTQKNFQIYFCSTAINLSFIKKSLGESSSDNLRLVELHFPDVLELPPQHHTTKNLPTHLMSTLMRSFQIAQASFSSSITTLKPDLIIYDSFQSWASTLAAIHGIPSVHFSTSGAASMSFFYHQLSLRRDSGTFPFSEIFQRDYERDKFESLVESNRGVAEDFAFRSFELSSEIVLMKSCIGLEDKYLDYLSFLCGKKMVTTGPLIQESHNYENSDDVGIIEFLNKKDQSSVVFVSFGSEYYLSAEEREEIAYGLELSNLSFIWVVRFPLGNTTSVEEALPEGFLERVKERGMVVDKWAPQAKILEHPSTCGFVSHCGWSSIMESLYYGVPVIAMPMHLDQPTNARFLVEIGVAMEVLRGENGQIRKEEVARVIKLVALEKNGEEIRRKARELSKMLRTKAEEELDEALEELRNLCSKNNQ